MGHPSYVPQKLHKDLAQVERRSGQLEGQVEELRSVNAQQVVVPL